MGGVRGVGWDGTLRFRDELELELELEPLVRSDRIVGTWTQRTVTPASR